MANVFSMAIRVRFKTLMDCGLCAAAAAAAAAGKTLLPSRAIAARRGAAGRGKKVRDSAPLEPLPSVPRKGSGKPEPFVGFFVELIGHYSGRVAGVQCLKTGKWLAVQAVPSQPVSCGTTETMAKANQGEL